MEKVPVKLILDKLNDRISAEDAVILDNWMSGEDEARIFNDVCTLWSSASAASKIEFSSEDGYRKLEAQLNPPCVRRLVRSRIAIVAAAVAIVAIPAILFRTLPSLKHNPETTEISVPLGSHVRNRLPDGTIVVLNAGSVLSYTSEFGRSDRNVRLDGEGFFEVSENEELPFTVTARGCDFKVLGTEFNISAYESEGLTVALMEGSLKVISSASSEMMSPGEIVSVDSETSGIRKWKGDVSLYKSWVNGFLRFESISLRNLVARLCREYNADIELSARDLEDRSLRISFNLNEPVGDILESLSSIIPIQVTTDGTKYRILSKN